MRNTLFSNKLLPMLLIALLGSQALISSKVYSIETIVVSGQRSSTDMFVVSCRGMDCKSSADSITDAINALLARAGQEYIEEADMRVDFCSVLKNSKPSHCESMVGSSPFWPHTIDSSVFWKIPSQTNGCGTGSILESVGGTVAKFYEVGGFSGNVDEPLQGRSFVGSCNAHDICYSTSSNKIGCDNGFQSSMRDTCSGDEMCYAFADLYASMVKLLGNDAFTKAGLVQICREYKEDMSDNCSGVSGGGLGET